MHLVSFEDTAAFLRRAEPFLLAYEATNNLVLGIAGWPHDRGKPDASQQRAYLAIVETDAGEVSAAALMTRPYKLVLSHVADADIPAVVNVLSTDLRHKGTVPGILGPSAVSRAFAEVWAAKSGQRVVLETAMRIYQLEAVHPVTDVSGSLRRATSSDRDLLTAWLAEFDRETGERVTGDEEVARRVDGFIQASGTGGLYFWDDAGRPVSMAAAIGPTPHGIRINSVYTPPPLRGQGYASAAVAALSQRQLDAGYRFCFLFTDLANPTSNHIYQQIGYRPMCDVDDYLFVPTDGTKERIAG